MFSAALSQSLLPLERGRRWPIGRMRGLFAGSDAIKSLTELGEGVRMSSDFLLMMLTPAQPPHPASGHLLPRSRGRRDMRNVDLERPHSGPREVY